MKYVMEEIEIRGSGISCVGEGCRGVIELKNDGCLELKIGGGKLNEVKNESMGEGIELNRKGSRSGGGGMLFRDYLKLSEDVKGVNGLEMEKGDEIGEEMLNVWKMVKEVKNVEGCKCDGYYEEVGSGIKK